MYVVVVTGIKLQLCDKCIRLTRKLLHERKSVTFCRMSREQKAVARARKAFETGRSKPLEHRIRQLKNLQLLLTERKKEILDAINKDLGKVSSTTRTRVQAFVCLCLLNIAGSILCSYSSGVMSILDINDWVSLWNVRFVKMVNTNRNKIVLVFLQRARREPSCTRLWVWRGRLTRLSGS